MGALDRVVKFANAKDVNRRQPLEKLLLKRLLSIYGVAGLLFLIKLRKVAFRKQWSSALNKVLRNSSSVAIASTLIPTIRAITGVSNVWITGLASSGVALMTSTELPGWLPSYVAVESVSDALTSTGIFKRALSGMKMSNVTMTRQMLLCLLIPFFYSQADRQNSAAARFLLNRRSLGRDFVLFYTIWNFLSVYNTLKGFFISKKAEKPYASPQYSSQQVDDWPMISGNLKPLMDKLGEIHEITLHDSYSLFEKIMNSALIDNVLPCFKWALWRQLCSRTMNHRPPKRPVVGAHLMNSITLMLGFFVLDGSGNKMNVRPGVLRYLLRCCISSRLKDTSLKVRRLITFLGSQLALRNVAQQLNHSK